MTEEKIISKGLQTTTNGQLLCPTCIHKCKGKVPAIAEYIHPIEVRIATKDKTVKINSNGVFTTDELTEDRKKAISDKGVRIVIMYYCKDGHLGEIIFQFHEGNTYVLHRFLEKVVCNTDERCKDIW
jgi:hypothetical protein